ncbi:DUF6191 domain-containing protein [Actinomadura hibisca]|uniref:DUF6191 domain-containing protein n=1 Tax=Actinomadura hibisca TaxID=68565 RepID=UPI0008340F08|nr:DUF6191 domain-containing protein [Actinomadura hibisca]
MTAVFFLTVPGLVIGLFVFAALDRAGVWASKRFRLPWLRGEGGRPVSATALEGFEVFYGPAKRHELEERRTSLVRRDEERDGAPPHGPLDLDAGIAVIRRPGGPATG